MNNLVTGIVGMVFGTGMSIICILVAPGMFSILPEKDSFEARELCNVMFNEKEPLTGQYVEQWISTSVVERFEREVSFLPEVAREEVRRKTLPYIESIQAGEVSEKSINNIAYIIEKAKPSS